MTQVGEAVGAPELIAEDDCPFDHSTGKPPTVENALIGKGGTLKSKMESGTSTHKYAYNPSIKVGADPKEKVLSPRNRADHPFKDGKKTLSVTDADDKTHRFAVSCAAHHCIPAQESLKRSPLLQFMVKKGETAKLKGTSYADGIVWSNVGYDANGRENGVFLPGSYAVSSHWRTWSDGTDDEEDDGVVSTDPNAAVLEGTTRIDEANPRWQYVRQAVNLAPGQFHDRHVDYSDFVLTILNKIHELFMDHKKATFDKDAGCPKCKENSDKIANDGIPTPFTLVARLNYVSGKLGNWLDGKTWRTNIYTSRWGKYYMAHLKKQQP